MLLLKFNPEELKDAYTVQQIYGVFGIGNEPEDQVHWDDPKVFGKKGDVRNIFCTQAIFDKVSENFHKNDLIGKNGAKLMMNYKDRGRVFEWANYSPTSVGPRYELMEKRLREVSAYDKLPDSVIAIFTPDDPEYEELPQVGENV